VSLQLTSLELPEAVRTLAGDWDALVRLSGADAAFSRPWIEACGRRLCEAEHVRLLAVRSEGGLVALFPFAVEDLRIGPVRITLARLLGPLPYFAVLGLPVLPEVAEEACALMLREAPRLLSVDALSLSQLSEAGEALAPLMAARARLPSGLVAEAGTTRPHMLIPLAASFDAYLAGLSRKRRVKWRKAKEEIERDHSITTSCLTGAGAMEFLDEFIARHDAQWQANGRRAFQRLAGKPGAFYRDLLPTAS
jgi:hypothetical protein